MALEHTEVFELESRPALPVTLEHIPTQVPTSLEQDEAVVAIVVVPAIVVEAPAIVVEVPAIVVLEMSSPDTTAAVTVQSHKSARTSPSIAGFGPFLKVLN